MDKTVFPDEGEDHQPAGQDDDQVQQDADKETLKLNDFNEDKPMPSILLPCPSQYALQKLKQGDYVELWYFSSEGYRKAKKEAHSTTDDAFGISNLIPLCTFPAEMYNG